MVIDKLTLSRLIEKEFVTVQEGYGITFDNREKELFARGLKISFYVCCRYAVITEQFVSGKVPQYLIMFEGLNDFHTITYQHTLTEDEQKECNDFYERLR